MKWGLSQQGWPPRIFCLLNVPHPQRTTPMRTCIVDKKFYDESGSVLCHPVVHWEGEPMERTTHPLNCSLYRRNVPCQRITLQG